MPAGGASVLVHGYLEWTLARRVPRSHWRVGTINNPVSWKNDAGGELLISVFKCLIALTRDGLKPARWLILASFPNNRVATQKR